MLSKAQLNCPIQDVPKTHQIAISLCFPRPNLSQSTQNVPKKYKIIIYYDSKHNLNQSTLTHCSGFELIDPNCLQNT